MSHRFFLNSPPSGNTVVLDGDQAHHALHVMRFKEGDEVVLFDGTGIEFVAVIDSIAKKKLDLRIVQTKKCSRNLHSSLTLAVALPKGDRQKFMVEKLVELGVESLVPLVTKRSVAKPNEKALQRLKKQVVEASKQCGRNALMEIRDSETLESLAESCHPEATKLFADPYQGNSIASFLPTTDSSSNAWVVVIGPEGGLDASETEDLMVSGFSPVVLGPTILRIETAAIAVASILGIGTEKR